MPPVAKKEEEEQQQQKGIRFGQGVGYEDGYAAAPEYVTELPMDQELSDDDEVDEGKAVRSHPSSRQAAVSMVKSGGPDILMNHSHSWWLFFL